VNPPTDKTEYLAAGALLALVVLVLAGRAIRRVLAGKRAENVLTVVAALIATSVQADGMWVFFRDVLHLPIALRIEGFAFIEVAIFVSGLRARRNIRETDEHTAGVDGIAVWALAAISATLAATAADSFRGVLLRLIVPAVAAWLWERGLTGERRRARKKDDGRGRRIHWRITPERILVRLGVAEPSDRTASEVDAHRRLTRVAVAQQRVRILEATGAWGWRVRRAERSLAARMRAAVEYANLTSDPNQQRALLAQIGALVHARSLAQVTPPPPWTVPADRPPLRLVTKDELAQIEAGQDSADVPAPIPEELEKLVRRARRKFRRDLTAGMAPSIAELKSALSIGQDKATAVKGYLAQESAT
jgi:hypothetical protein